MLISDDVINIEIGSLAREALQVLCRFNGGIYAVCKTGVRGPEERELHSLFHGTGPRPAPP